MDRYAYAAAQAPLVLEDARAGPSGRWARARTYWVRLEVAYRPVPSCRPGPSDEVLRGDAANRPYEAPDDEDEARAHHPPCEDEAYGVNRSSFRGVASDAGLAKRHSDGAPRSRHEGSAGRRASALSPVAAAVDSGVRPDPHPQAAAAARSPCC